MKEKIREVLLQTYSLVDELIITELYQIFHTELVEIENDSYQSGYDDGYAAGSDDCN